MIIKIVITTSPVAYEFWLKEPGDVENLISLIKASDENKQSYDGPDQLFVELEVK